MPKLQLINAVLVRLNISTFSNSRTDKEITAEVQFRKKLEIGAGKWTRYKFPKECLEPITKHAGEIRRWHYDHTSPWEDGTRLLNVVGMSKYQESLTTKAKEFFALVDEFGAHWGSWLDQARLMHGPTFNSADYPANWKVMRESFGIAAEYGPMPEPDQFALRGVAESALKTMKDSLESRVEQRIQSITENIWRRLLDPVRHMADVLANNDPRIYETLVTNITGICDMVPTLNVQGDTGLNRAADQIRNAIARVDIEALREERSARKEVQGIAKNLIAQFGQFGNRKIAV